MVFIYITCKNIEEAEKIGKILLEKKLCGCVNIWPMKSFWRDNGDINDSEEAVLLVKTIESKVGEITELVKDNHGYKTPCIATISVDRLSNDYKEWLMQCIQ